MIKHRAIHPDDPLPAPYAILAKFSQPPKEVVEKSAGILQKLIQACNVKKGLFDLVSSLHMADMTPQWISKHGARNAASSRQSPNQGLMFVTPLCISAKLHT